MGLRRRVLAFASQTFPRLSSRYLASAGYTLDLDRYGSFDDWSAETVARQDRAWRPIIEAAKRGDLREDVQALHDAFAGLPSEGRVLEVGCGAGYNSELVDLAAPGLDYVGIDISADNIELARQHYPQREFVLGSAYELPFPDASFTAVLDGAALLQLTDWQKAVGEYVRVAADAVILHSVTLCKGPTVRFAKYAYGQPTVEQAIQRSELEALVSSLGRRVTATIPGDDYDLGPFLGIPTVSETWVIRR